MLQKAVGNWELDTEFATVIEVPLAKLRGNIPAEVDESAWATMLAISYLEISSACNRDEWKLLAGKASKWLLNHIAPDQVEEIVQLFLRSLPVQVFFNIVGFGR